MVNLKRERERYATAITYVIYWCDVFVYIGVIYGFESTVANAIVWQFNTARRLGML